MSIFRGNAKLARQFLFGYSDTSPVERKTFIQASLFLFLVRGTTEAVLGLIFIHIFDYADLNILQEIILVLLALIISCTFYIPYFRLEYRRLKGIGFPFPAFLTLLTVVGIFTFIYNTPYALDIYPIALDILIHVGVYLLLLPWKDKL